MKRVLFIDRDGTLIQEPPDQQVDSLEKLAFVPGVISALGRIARSGKYELVMVTNQDGLGTHRFPEATFWPAHEWMLRTLDGEGIAFRSILIDRSLPEENKPTRKPGTALLTEFLQGDYDLANSFVIGDRLTDIQLAKNIGAMGILLGETTRESELKQADLAGSCALLTTDWNAVAIHVLSQTRKSSVRRTTRETDVRVDLVLGSAGSSDIRTGLNFLDHMLEQWVRHGLMTLNVQTNGDLHIDEHHTVEDTALALGTAFREALADKRGLARYGFCLPMDDCLAQVAVDFGGRPWLEWNVTFARERIGDVPTELFHHFFKSFSDEARCNLHVQADGVNEHHKIEAIFKAFARAVRMAVADDGSGVLPSTKGAL